MQVKLESASQATEATKALRKALAEHGTTIKHSRAQDLLAFCLGFPDAFAMRKASRPTKPAVLDDHAEPDVVASRRAFQTKRLSEALDIDGRIATQVIQSAQPSGTRRDRATSQPVRTSDAVADAVQALADALDQDGTSATMEYALRGTIKAILCARSNRPNDDVLTVSLDEFLGRMQPDVEAAEDELDESASDIVIRANGPDDVGWSIVRRHIAMHLCDPVFKARQQPDAFWWGQFRRSLPAAFLGQPDEALNQTVFEPLVDRVVNDLKARYGHAPVIERIVRTIGTGLGFAPEVIRYDDDGRPEPSKRQTTLTVRNTTVTLWLEPQTYAGGFERGTYVASVTSFRAAATTSDRTVGVISGEIVSSRTKGGRMDDEDLYFVMDSVSEDLAVTANLLLAQKTADEVFAAGDVLYLDQWEVSPEMRGTGYARDMLKAVTDELRRRFRRLASIGYHAYPAQFPNLFDRAMPREIVAWHDAARDRLKAYLRRVDLQRLLSPNGVDLEVRPTHADYRLTDQQRYRRLTTDMKARDKRKRAARAKTPTMQEQGNQKESRT